MGWWSLALSVVAVLTGVYGAWRSWKTDRRITATSEKWSLTHFQNDAYLLTNLLPYRAMKVTLAPPEGMNVTRDLPQPCSLEPNESVTFMPQLRTGMPPGTKIGVRWSHTGRKHREGVELVIPPKR